MNTPPSPSEDPLETLLRKNRVPLADNGFSARVIHALPAPESKPRRQLNHRLIACCLGGLVGMVFASAQSGMPSFAALHSLGSSSMSTITKLAQHSGDWHSLAITASIVAVSLTVAFYREIAERFDL